MSYSPLIGKLHTRYSPVRRSPAEYYYSPLPLDLHVLSLSLAFILSQDQTLRCWNCFMSLLKIPLFPQVQVLLTVFILNTCTTVVYVIFSKNSSQSVSCETWCKGKDLYFYLPNFFEVFFDLFFRKTAGRIRISAWILPTSSSFLSGSLAPLHHVVSRISLDCGCKSTAL